MRFESVAESYASDTMAAVEPLMALFESVAESYASDTRFAELPLQPLFESVAESYASDTTHQIRMIEKSLRVLPNPMPQTPSS